jgi:tRNA dimethylallyltransferase
MSFETITPEISRKVICICGPTASGKSDLALTLVDHFRTKQRPASIVNCDSIQVYQDLLIGSASPTDNEKKSCPHYLYNYVSFPEEVSLGSYYRDFAETLKQIPLDHVILVVGGSGFYLQALENGLFDMPAIPALLRQQVQEDLKSMGAETLFEELKQGDPQTAQRIHIKDHNRLTRAIEVLRGRLTTMTLAGKHKQKLFDLKMLKLGIHFTKEELRARVQQRTHKMLDHGLLNETEGMLKQGREVWAPLNSVGYLEAKLHLQGQLTKAQLEPEILLKTMQLIKKQMTWFKRDSSINWKSPEQFLDFPRLIDDFFLGA